MLMVSSFSYHAIPGNNHEKGSINFAHSMLPRQTTYCTEITQRYSTVIFVLS